MSVALKSHLEALFVRTGLGDLKGDGVIMLFLLWEFPVVLPTKPNVYMFFFCIREKSSQLWQGNSQYSDLDQGKGLKDLPFFFPDFLYKSQF